MFPNYRYGGGVSSLLWSEHRVKGQVREKSGDLLDHAQRRVCASLQALVAVDAPKAETSGCLFLRQAAFKPRLPELDGERYPRINLHRDHVAIRARSRRRREHYPRGFRFLEVEVSRALLVSVPGSYNPQARCIQPMAASRHVPGNDMSQLSTSSAHDCSSRFNNFRSRPRPSSLCIGMVSRRLFLPTFTWEPLLWRTIHPAFL